MQQLLSGDVVWHMIGLMDMTDIVICCEFLNCTCRCSVRHRDLQAQSSEFMFIALLEVMYGAPWCTTPKTLVSPES